MERTGFQEATTGYTGAAAHSPRLTSSEISHLWNNYVDTSMLTCLLRSFSAAVQDQDIKSLLNEQLGILDRRQQMVTDIMRKENLTIPRGFSEEDVDLNSPRLYSDDFCLHFLKFKQRFEIPLGSLDFVNSTRADIMDYYRFRMTTSTDLMIKITAALLAKGLYVRPPYITIAKDVDLVKDKAFLAGYFKKKRPLLAQEVSALFHLIQPNYIGKFLLMGFRQTARAKAVREYMDWGASLTDKMIDTFSYYLKAEDIPVPTFWDDMVTDSTTPPFSDGLMMHSLTLLSSAGFFVFSYVMKNTFRHDIKGALLKLFPELNDFGEAGINLRIEHGWFEEPPRTVDRRELVNEPVKH